MDKPHSNHPNSMKYCSSQMNCAMFCSMNKNNGSDKNGAGLNGSGNGHDTDSDETKIVQFPTLADRDRLRREKIAAEEAWRAEYKAKQKAMQKAGNPPFLNIGNIPPFVKVVLPLMIGIQAFISLFMSETEIFRLFNTFGFVPANVWPAPTLTAIITPITHIFLHGGWMHLAFNSFMLVAMGIFFSREFGTRLTIAFFLISGIGGAILYMAVNMGAQQPLIGASGSISGFFAVFLVMAQKRGAFSGFKVVRKYGALPVLAFWLLLMFLIAQISGGQSWEAHTGGFITGLLFLSWILHSHLKIWKI